MAATGLALGGVVAGVIYVQPPAVVRVTPRNPVPGDTARCHTQGPLWAGGTPQWSLDGEALPAGAEVSVPDAVGGVLACSVGDEEDVVAIRRATTQNNVLLVLLDDVGVDRISRYGMSKITPRTPTFDRLADHGVTFTQAYSSPSCTPTRVGILTGLHAMNAGIGTPLAPDENGLPYNRYTLPEALDDLTGNAYAHAAIGKWHITSPSQGDEGPNLTGFQHFSGNITNLASKRNETYFSWTKVVDGVASRSSNYATTDNVDDTLAFVERAGEQPWFVWLALNSAHVPFHVPPANLLPSPVEKPASPAVLFDAMVTAADREVGRLLRSLSPEQRARTTVIVLGDNGTAREAVRPPTDEDKAKFSLFEGGVHVPMVIAGAGVEKPGRSVDALVSYIDLFPTVLELAGVELTAEQEAAVDGSSIVRYLSSDHAPDHRDAIYAESFNPNGTDLSKRRRWTRMLRIGSWKLIRNHNSGDELYHIRDGLDGRDLLASGEPLEGVAARAYEGLKQALQRRYKPR